MKKWFVFSFILLIIIIISGSIYVYMNTTKPITNDERKFIELAKEHGDLVEDISIDWFHYIDAYSVITGKDRNGREMIVWINKKNDNVFTEEARKGQSREDIIDMLNNGQIDGLSNQDTPKEYIHVKLGMYEESPIWEVTYIDQRDRYTFLYLDFYTGKLFRKYNL